jgi:cytidylate kinase
MQAAPDAHLIDTTHLDIQAAFDVAVGLIKRKIDQQRPRHGEGL